MNIYSQRLSDFRVLDRGGEAELLLARDQLGGQDVVLKKYLPGSPMTRDSHERLIRLSRQLGDSGFLAAQDVIVDGGRLAGHTSMLIEPGSLSEIAGELDTAALFHVLESVCQTLAYLHSLDFVHCDIKPDNILVARQDGNIRAYVTDLGLAVSLGSQFLTSVQGTREFMAPEQSAGQPLTETADVYSFGKTLQKLAPHFKDACPVAEIDELAKYCAETDPGKRPQSFWEIRDRLEHICRDAYGPGRHEMLSPPLRDAGVRLRVINLLRHVSGDDVNWQGLCLVAGHPGVGKSRVLGEFCLDRQLAGEETIRLTEIANPMEMVQFLRGSLPTLVQTAGRNRYHRLWVAGETHPGCQFSLDDLRSLNAMAVEYGIVVLLEHRVSNPVAGQNATRLVRIKPFSLRETIIAASHLQKNPALSFVSGRALQLATGGNPSLTRAYLQTRLTGSPGAHDDEPVDFDRLDRSAAGYWEFRYHDLPVDLQTLLGRASVFHDEVLAPLLAGPGALIDEVVRHAAMLADQGWLKRMDTDDDVPRYQFLCRSARNFVRCQSPRERLKAWAEDALAAADHLPGGLSAFACDTWELHRFASLAPGTPSAHELWNARRGIADSKLATYALLKAYRRERTGGGENLAKLASDICDGYAEIGSIRRQQRWAEIAFNRLRQQQHGGGMSLAAAHFLCRVHDLSRKLPPQQEALTALLDDSGIADGHVRGYLLSELGTVHLMQSEYDAAGARYFEAHHLLEDAAPDSAEYVRNLNRLGLVLMRIGRYTAARKHLERCRKLAQQLHFDGIARPALGNLVILERAMGDPEAAAHSSRRVLESYRSARDSLGYLRALPDKVMCLVDLGQCYAAKRTAQVAIRLANLHSDQYELRHAMNNLGWILTMQGEVGRAQEHLDEAIRLHMRTRDFVWVARTKLNIAWNYLIADCPEEAENLCLSAVEEIEKQKDLHGGCEAFRILAQAAVMREDCAAAEAYLGRISRDVPLLSPRDQAETALARLNLDLWMQRNSEAERLVNDLANDPVVENVHSMRCDFGRMRGVWYTLQGDYDRSLDILSATASDCRRGGRVDKLIDTLIALVFLAGRMHNWPVGRGYLRTVTRMASTMRGQLHL